MCDNWTTFCDESLRINVVHVDDIETSLPQLSPQSVYFLFSAQFERDICSEIVTWYITLRMLDDILWKEECNIWF